MTASESAEGLIAIQAAINHEDLNNGLVFTNCVIY
jgi:hypothetical protein